MKQAFTDPHALHNILRAPIRTRRLVIRKARESDAAILSELYNAHDKEYAHFGYCEWYDFSEETTPAWIEHLKTLEREGWGSKLFYFHKGRVIGGSQVYIDSHGFNRISYYIDPDFRKQDLAHEAVTAIKQRMEAAGYNITLRIPPENKVSKAFAVSLGLYPHGKRRWYDNPYEPVMITMRPYAKRLDHSSPGPAH